MDDKKIQVESNFIYAIENHEGVKLIKQGDNFADVVFCQRKTKGSIKKISKDEYVNARTGEVERFNHKEGKEDIKSLKATFKRLIGLIRCNFTAHSEKQLFITLTYAENMTDSKKLMKDFEKFYKRLQYKFKDHKFKYIVVAEPQERGAWHCHLMLKSNKALYISDAVMRDLWGHGFTTTQRLKSDDVGTYYVAYFTNLETESVEGSNKNTKKHIKGSRLHFYPKNFKFYRCSRGLDKPVIEYTSWGDVVEKYGRPKWEGSFSFYQMKDGKKLEVNLIHKASFKKE